MINLAQLTMRFGAKILFENVSASFKPGCRYGIIGANGAGKSTLLKIISHELEPESGQVVIGSGQRMSVLKQNHFDYEEESILNTVLMGNKALYDAMVEKDKLYQKPELTDKDNERLNDLEMVVAENEGYDAEYRASELLEQLSIPTVKHYEKMKTLSGGDKVRVLLAQCLFPNPDILLMDEPTNNLDVHSIRWLEDYICSREGIVLIVSHDRHFINQTVTHIADIDYGTINFYTGNYDYYLAANRLSQEQKELHNMKLEKRKQELEAFVARFSANASKSTQASSRQKLLEKLDKQFQEIRPSSRQSPSFSFKPNKPIGRQLLTINNISKTFTGTDGEPIRLFQNLSFQLSPDDRLAVVGPNGIGKTTLMKILSGELKPDSGTVEWGVTTERGYLPQDHKGEIPADTTPFAWLTSFAPWEPQEVIRGLLGRMLFRSSDQEKPTKGLSGGEKARLLLAKLMLDCPNVLILDEPTNHLDLETITALNDSLKAFTGSLVFVSHDVEFIGSLATKVLQLLPNGEYRIDDVQHTEYAL